MLRLVPINGYAAGLDAVKFLVLPIILAAVAPGRRGAPVPRDVPRGDRCDYVRTARAKGLSEAVVLFRHVLRTR